MPEVLVQKHTQLSWRIEIWSQVNWFQIVRYRIKNHLKLFKKKPKNKNQNKKKKKKKSRLQAIGVNKWLRVVEALLAKWYNFS